MSAADEEILTTTVEFGITISPSQIFDAIQESQEFWGPVRHYIASDKFAEGDPAVRREAAEFIRKVNDRLEEQMFRRDEQASIDLINYLATRLRMITLYRSLRATVGDDELALAIKADWERELRHLASLEDKDREARLLEVQAEMQAIYGKLGLDEAQSGRCSEIWNTLTAVSNRLNSTSTGQIMLSYEREVRASDSALSVLICEVVYTADWAEITRPEGTTMSRANFEQAWIDLKKSRSQRIARLAEARARSESSAATSIKR